jgi:hypothetical protein
MEIAAQMSMGHFSITMLSRTKYNLSLQHRFWTRRSHPSIRITSKQLNFLLFNSEIILKNWMTLLLKAIELILFFLQLVALILKTKIVSSRAPTSYFISNTMAPRLKCTKKLFNKWWMLLQLSPIQILKFRTTLHFLTIGLFKIVTIKNCSRILKTLHLLTAKAYITFLLIRG